MDVATIWDGLAELIRSVPRSQLLLIAVFAMACSLIGAAMVRRKVPLGRLLGSVSTLVLMGVLAVVVLQLARLDPRLDIAIPDLGLPEQTVEGGETRIPMAPDGHFWVEAEVNGVTAPFLIDSGATLTTVSGDFAEQLGLEPRDGGMPIVLQTANGSVTAQLTTIDELSFGNISASGLDGVIAPNIGPTNVIGMNFMSRLGSWRVENNTMILVPGEGTSAESPAQQ